MHSVRFETVTYMCVCSLSINLCCEFQEVIWFEGKMVQILSVLRGSACVGVNFRLSVFKVGRNCISIYEAVYE